GGRWRDLRDGGERWCVFGDEEVVLQRAGHTLTSTGTAFHHVTQGDTRGRRGERRTGVSGEVSERRKRRRRRRRRRRGWRCTSASCCLFSTLHSPPQLRYDSSFCIMIISCFADHS